VVHPSSEDCGWDGSSLLGKRLSREESPIGKVNRLQETEPFGLADDSDAGLGHADASESVEDARSYAVEVAVAT
jgi:hypothetical protein